MERWMLCVLLLACVTQAGWPCTCAIPSGAEALGRATTVFHARVLGTRLHPASDLPGAGAHSDDLGADEYVAAQVEVLEVFKGTPGTAPELRSLVMPIGVCLAPLLAGMHYVIFANPDDRGFVLTCNGSFVADGDQLESLPQMQALRASSGRQHPTGTLLHDDARPLAVAGAAAPLAGSGAAEAEYDALVARWRAGESLDVAALMDAFVRLPDLEERVPNGATLLNATNMGDYDREQAMRIFDHALSRAYPSLALHALALRSAERFGDHERAARERVQMAAIAKWIEASGDGTEMRPYKVLFTADALAFVERQGRTQHGALVRLLGRQPRLDVLVANPPGAAAPFAEPTFEVLQSSIAMRERADAERAVLPRFSEHVADAAFLTGQGAYQDDSAMLAGFALLLPLSGVQDSEEAEFVLEHLRGLPDRAHNSVARNVEATLQLARSGTPAAERREAIAELVQQARDGVPRAIAQLGSVVGREEGHAMTAADARTLLERNAAAGVPESQYALARALLREDATDAAKRWLLAAADNGSVQALGMLAWLRAGERSLDPAFMARVREAAAVGEPHASVVAALADLDGLFGTAAPERARRDLLLLAADATSSELVNTVAYGLATGDPAVGVIAVGESTVGRNAALAIEMLDALFEAWPPTKDVAAYVDSRGVALAAAGRRPEALLELKRAAALANQGNDALARHLVQRHLERVQANQAISPATDEEDAGSFRE